MRMRERAISGLVAEAVRRVGRALSDCRSRSSLLVRCSCDSTTPFSRFTTSSFDFRSAICRSYSCSLSCAPARRWRHARHAAAGEPRRARSRRAGLHNNQKAPQHARRERGAARRTFCLCLKRAAARLRAYTLASAWYTKKQPPLNPDTCATRSAAATRLFCSRTDCFNVEPLVRSERPDEPAVAPLRAPRPPPLLACCSCGSAAAATLRVATAPRLPAAFRSA